MTGTEYLMQMHVLTEELNRSASAEPYDPVANKDIVTKMDVLNRQWSKDLAERRRIKNLLCVGAIIIILFMFFLILFELLN